MPKDDFAKELKARQVIANERCRMVPSSVEDNTRPYLFVHQNEKSDNEQCKKASKDVIEFAKKKDTLSARRAIADEQCRIAPTHFFEFTKRPFTFLHREYVNDENEKCKKASKDVIEFAKKKDTLATRQAIADETCRAVENTYYPLSKKPLSMLFTFAQCKKASEDVLAFAAEGYLKTTRLSGK